MLSRPAGVARIVSAPLGGMAAASQRAADQLAGVARTARFLHGLGAFQSRPDDIFISSYPRSGTTWLQQILVVLAHDGDPGFGHVSEVAPWFERNLALGRATVTDYARRPGPRIFKSHLPLAWLPRGARYVYVVRDGRDVAVSYYHLYRSHLGFEGDFGAFFERFMRGRVQYGSWFKHVAGWRRAQGRPDVCWLGYEEMRADLVGAMARLSAFCGFSHSRERLSELADACGFAYMKAHEDRFDHATEERAMRGMATGQFVRAGGSGAHGSYFDPDQTARFRAHAARTLRLPQLEWDLPAFLH